MLTVIVEHLGGNVVLRCRGRIVRGEESAILCAAIQQRVREVTLDLSDVSAIDAAGIGALVLLQAAGIYLKLVNATATVREVLRLTKLDSLFDISGSESIDATLEDLAKDRSGVSLHL